MALAKIPLIALFTYSYHASFTPPQPRPRQDELIATIDWDFHVMNIVRPKITVVTQDVSAILEITTILAVTFPSAPLTNTVLPFLRTKREGGNEVQFEIDALSIVGVALVFAGALIRLWTFRVLGRFFRFDISIQRDHELIMNGPYAWVRHPSYAGVILAFAGCTLYNASPFSWLRQSGFLHTLFGKMFIAWYCGFVFFYSLVVLLGRMSKEDEALRVKFGKKWDDWAKRVPYSVIPGVY